MSSRHTVSSVEARRVEADPGLAGPAEQERLEPEIRDFRSFDELVQLERLYSELWRSDGPAPISAELMRALEEAGNYVRGAFLDGRLIGGLIGFFGLRRGHPLHLHSHILGVPPGQQRRGTGYQLKQDQRAWALARGISEITWTFDPLVRRNGYFNVGKLAVEVRAYFADFYGPMRDSINAGDASDRALAVWRLDSDAACSGGGRNRRDADLQALLAEGAQVALREAPDGAPLAGSAGARVLLCQVPEDIVALRHEHPELAHAWRLALRDTFGRAVSDGFTAVGITRSGWYVLEKTG